MRHNRKVVSHVFECSYFNLSVFDFVKNVYHFVLWSRINGTNKSVPQISIFKIEMLERGHNFQIMSWLSHLRVLKHVSLTYFVVIGGEKEMSHYSDVLMGTMAFQITSIMIVYSTVYSGADQRKHQSSASLAFVRGIHRLPVNFPHKGPVTRKMFPFDDVIMYLMPTCIYAQVNLPPSLWLRDLMYSLNITGIT